MSVQGVILAAGKGTRMKSEMPKALHPVCGVPMVDLVGRAMRAAGIAAPIVVVGHGADAVREALAGSEYRFAIQAEQLGTGHAVRMAEDPLRGYDGPVIVAPGDTPLLDAGVFDALLRVHREQAAAATVATSIVSDPTGYGRLIRDPDGRAVAIVEEKDATADEREVREVNAGVYCFDAVTLFRILPQLSSANAQGEYYLTDAIRLLASEGAAVATAVFEDPSVLVGVNDRRQLAEASDVLRQRTLVRHMLDGVTIIDPETTYIGLDVTIEPDVTIAPMTTLEGVTSIGSGSTIGPVSRVKDSRIGRGCTVLMSFVDRARMADGSRCGPYAHLRPGADVGDGVKIGNFVEIKNAVLAPGSQVSHLSYIGDAEVGAGTNIGAGTITCNYDGFEKHKTTIGANAFVGSNSTLVAPVTIGDGVVIAAGSTITHDVGEDELGIGRSRQENKPEWARQWRERKRKRT
ncbi:MAG TPA: bifunctional UDP-N-acetylglucosamine diphosphorylase/glucosamine-1-phosphate N-acetyltransferase GlmU [Fimbriimonadaceae bacterium]|nr:bifunctional UDP-N-acetylglucosamine diphosphorylase/glucosamine-1-phosphate N-acetyltransferase GlmU [Fimbriimonadaceae bacterium]